MTGVCNCTDLNRITRIVDGLVKEAAEEKAHLANQWWVIVLAYTCVILPWGLLYNIDFISEKWRTVHRTRFLGYVHMTFAIAPMPFIIFYAHLQQVSEDYKEMMTALVAILLSIYHVMRTVWGLIQLASFSKWCSLLVQRMCSMGMINDVEFDDYIREEEDEKVMGLQGFTEKAMKGFKVVWNGLKNSMNKVFRMKNTRQENEAAIRSINTVTYDGEQLESLMENVSKVLKVNNKLVDNEMGGTDMTVKIGIWNSCGEKLKAMFKVDTDVCDDASVITDIPPKLQLTSSGFLTIEEKELCTVRWSGAFLSSFGEYWMGWRENSMDPTELLEKCQRSLDTLELVTFPVNGRRMSFSTMPLKEGGPYSSHLDLSALGSTPVWLKNRKRELENLMGGFPGTGFRQNSRRPEVVLVQALLYAQSIDKVIFDSLMAYHSKFNIPQNRNGWCLLLWQKRELPSDHELDSMNPLNVPPFPWRRLQVPLWDKCTNWRVLQASVHADNRLNLYYYHEDTFEGNSKQPICWFEHIQKKYGEEHIYNEERYVGTVLETVRTFLADWMSRQTPIYPDWCPALPTEPFQFSIKQDLILGDDNSIDDCLMLWRWECQSRLQETIAGMDLSEVELPSSIELILLFVLGFPGVISVSDSGETESRKRYGFENTEVGEGILPHALEFKTNIAPQNINVRIRIFEMEGKEEKNVLVELVSAASVKEFRWEDWINSVMGFIKAADEFASKRDIAEGKVPWRKRTPCKVNLNEGLMKVSRRHFEPQYLPGDIQVWTGWPFFDIKIVQFEMDKWLLAAEVVRSDIYNFRLHVKRAEEGLMEMSEWTDAKWRSIREEEKEYEIAMV